MLTFYTSWFSPFARKVALALDYKGLDYTAVDALAHEHLDDLRAVNPRAEVPALVDGDTVVANSADILGYLDRAYPEPSVYPHAPRDYAVARSLERLADTRLDALLTCCSLWAWAIREDAPPAGLKAAGQSDLNQVLAALDAELAGEGPWMFGTPSVVEFAYFPHLTAVAFLSFELDESRYPRVAAWFSGMLAEPLFAKDAQRCRDYLEGVKGSTDYERRKLAWRGDRIEWLLARGFHEWFAGEIEADRVIWPAGY